ncbi:hypothetical protein C1I91_06825 [Clostridium manihotivorum]|uniref:Uncharacterized protein n=1 Tax=Clostridium manihotivorum TaxID=2320868 RepID=A0A3R5UE73_9CLOT|nr:hypothetical protein C1I91_06825 [Clostridium manihotivorum]
MEVISFIQSSFKGWDWYITFFTLTSWILLIFLLFFLLIQFFLLLFKVKYKNKEFEDYVSKNKND